MRCGAVNKPPHGINDKYGRVEESVVLATDTKTNVTVENSSGEVDGNAGSIYSDPESHSFDSLETESETELNFIQDAQEISTATAEKAEAETDVDLIHFGEAVYTEKARMGVSNALNNIVHKSSERVYHSVFGNISAKINEKSDAEAIYTSTADLGEADGKINEESDAEAIYTSTADLGEGDSKTEVSQYVESAVTKTADLAKSDEIREYSQSIYGIDDASTFSKENANIETHHRAEGYVEKPVVTGDFISFSSASPFTLKMYNSTSYLWDGTMEYSVDSINWNVWDGTLIDGTNKLYLRGTNNTKAKGLVNWMVFDGNGISVAGNVETLLDYKTVQAGNHPTIAESTFQWIFRNVLAITDASGLIIGCSVIPKNGCYGMFEGCSNLEKPPIFKAKDLYDLAYYEMFWNCTKLNAISAMPETSAERDRCYGSMYKGCVKIKISETQTDEYINAWKMPQMINNRAENMFAGTGGTFTGTPRSNNIYYTANEIIS